MNAKEEYENAKKIVDEYETKNKLKKNFYVYYRQFDKNDIKSDSLLNMEKINELKKQLTDYDGVISGIIDEDDDYEYTQHDDVAIVEAFSLREAIKKLKKFYSDANSKNTKLVNCNSNGENPIMVKDIMIVSLY